MTIGSDIPCNIADTTITVSWRWFARQMQGHSAQTRSKTMAQQQTHTKRAQPTRPAAVKETARAVPARQQANPAITTEQRHLLIAEAAFLIAEQRGFQGDKALDDWLQAEAVVDSGIKPQH
jgi:hypothetical protein